MDLQNNTARLRFPPFLQCTRTGNGEWRCQSMVAPGRSYCERHYKEQKIRNERKRERKLASAMAKSKNPSTGSSIRNRAPAGLRSKRITKKKRMDEIEIGGQKIKPKDVVESPSPSDEEEEEEELYEESDEESEEISETESFKKRFMPRGFRFSDEDIDDGSRKTVKTKMRRPCVGEDVRDYYRSNKKISNLVDGRDGINENAKLKRTSGDGDANFGAHAYMQFTNYESHNDSFASEKPSA
ncbi:uncharacterized protein A4U43_C06F16580 [Asparagus officinalis]|uniref:WRC domain-containing protein n=1 Tax=Asparagus officinalis TaxID=4686 RepID=A0A5P1EMC4_ASPOF|nr:uncharacterized protein A4U43_C06F16580 [Asparagus officinalis]